MNHRIEEIKRKIIPLLSQYSATRAGLFGSAARGEETESSDIDLIVEIKKDISLLEFVELKLKLEELLERKVDLIEYDTLKPALKKRILSEQIVLI